MPQENYIFLLHYVNHCVSKYGLFVVPTYQKRIEMEENVQIRQQLYKFFMQATF